MIKFRCIECQKKVGVADDAAGKRAKCPQCKAIMRVPIPQRVVEADLALAEAEPVMRLAAESGVGISPAPRTERPVAADRPRRQTPRPARQRDDRRKAPQPRAGVADHTVAGEVLNLPAPAGVAEPVAQIERRQRQHAMDSIAGLGALSEEAPPELMSFGSAIRPAQAAKRGRSGPRRTPALCSLACGTCGTSVVASARFCTGCGTPLAVPDLPVDDASAPISLPVSARPQKTGWRAGFFGWLVGAR